MDLALIFDQIKVGQAYCNVVFASFYYPTYFGVFLTMLIAAVRYFLAKKVFKNDRPSNFKVTCWSLSIFGLIVVVNVIHVTVNFVLDIPIGRIAEGCAREARGEARPVYLINVMMLLFINIYPVISIVTDLYLLAFIRKTVKPIDHLTTMKGQYHYALFYLCMLRRRFFPMKCQFVIKISCLLCSKYDHYYHI